MTVSSRSSSTEVYQKIFIFRVWQRVDETLSAREVNPLGTAAAPKVAPGAKVGGRGRGVPPLARAGLYMRARRYRRCPHTRAGETGNKTHHGPPVAPPDRAWCVLFRVSLAHVAMYYRCRGLLGGCAVPSSASKVSRGWEKSIPYCQLIWSFFHVPGSAKKTGEVRHGLDNFWT